MILSNATRIFVSTQALPPAQDPNAFSEQNLLQLKIDSYGIEQISAAPITTSLHFIVTRYLTISINSQASQACLVSSRTYILNKMYVTTLSFVSSQDIRLAGTQWQWADELDSERMEWNNNGSMEAKRICVTEGTETEGLTLCLNNQRLVGAVLCRLYCYHK